MTPRIVRLSLAAFFSIAACSMRAQTPPVAQPLPPTAAGSISMPQVTPTPVKGDDQLVSIKLSDDTIDQVLVLLENYTGRSILRPGNGLPTAPYTVNLKNIPKSEAILALETLLALNQVGVSPLGDRLLKVVPLGFIKTEAPEMLTGSAFDVPPSGKIATKIFQFDFLRAAEFVPQLGGILNNGVGGGVVVLDKANAAMITDTVSNLQRVESLMKALDKPVTAGMNPKFYTLRNGAKASDVVNKLRTIISGTLQQQLGTATTFNADDRTNQIVLISDPRQYPFFDDLIAKLDIKADPNTRNDVIYLKHAIAADVQKLLTQLVTSQAAAAQRNASQSVRPGQFAYPNQPNVTLPTPNNPATPNAAPNATPASTGPQGLENLLSGTNEFSTILNVVNDDRSNAIIVSGTVDDIRLIKELVAKIDIILAQVKIEVIIAEVTLTDADRSGISALNLTVNTDAPANPLTGGDNGRGTHITNVAGTVAGWAVTSGVVNPMSFAAAFSDAGNRNHVKVIQAPTIVTTHNKLGEVIVGQEVPYISNATSNTTATANNTDVVNQSVAFKQINLDLKVTPLIGDDGSIYLNIDQLIQDQIGSITVNGSPTPIIGTRHATSYISVFDNQMIVLGGLQRTSLTNSRQKLGFIYEIPILSHLLGDRSKKIERTELLLFIRPHVPRPEDGTPDANKTIDTLSNKEQVHQYLKDPSVQAKESLLEKVK